MNAALNELDRRFPRRWEGLLGMGAILAGMVWSDVTSLQAATNTNPPSSTIVRRAPGGLSPVPVITSMEGNAPTVELSWFGITPPYQVQTRDQAGHGTWKNVGSGTFSNFATVSGLTGQSYFRVRATTPNYVGAETCSSCHPGKHADWLTTAHAGALETLKRIGQGANSGCLACHTVGYGLPGGFVNEAATPQLAGVQCENCHGPGGNHVLNPNILGYRPKIELSSLMCGGCHTDAHHPTFDEWELSRHAHALSTIKNSSFSRDTCLECHSVDYRYAKENGLKLPTKQTAQLSLECATCHEAHGGTSQHAQLRKPIAQLCGECHTQEEAKLGDSPHHPQFEMLSGIGAFTEDGGSLTNTMARHTTLVAEGGQACARCHVVMHEVDDPNEGNPNVTGHTFNPFDESITEHQANKFMSCGTMEGDAGCHPATGFLSASRALPRRQTATLLRLAALAPYFDKNSASYIDPAKLSAEDQQRLSVAKFNYQFVDADGSKGVHSPANSSQALDIAEAIVNSLSTPTALSQLK